MADCQCIGVLAPMDSDRTLVVEEGLTEMVAEDVCLSPFTWGDMLTSFVTAVWHEDGAFGIVCSLQ